MRHLILAATMLTAGFAVTLGTVSVYGTFRWLGE
jgi:hypothetical protein